MTQNKKLIFIIIAIIILVIAGSFYYFKKFNQPAGQPPGEINPDIHWNPNEEDFDSGYYLNKKYKGRIITKDLNAEIEHQDVLTGEFVKHKYTFNIYLPQNYEKNNKEYPLIFTLHGCEGNGFQELVSSAPNLFNDKISWLELVDQKNDIIAASITSESSRWCKNKPEDDGLVLKDKEAIEESMGYLLANYRIKKDKTFFTGFSAGGNGIHYTGPRTPNLFKYVIGRSAIFQFQHHNSVDWQKVKDNNQEYHLLTNPSDGAYQANKEAYGSYLRWGIKTKLYEDKGFGHDVLKQEAIELVRNIIEGTIKSTTTSKEIAPFGFYGPVEVTPSLHDKNIFTKNRDYKSLAKILKDAGGDWIYAYDTTLNMGGLEYVRAFAEQGFLIVGEIINNFEFRLVGDPVLLPKNIVNYEKSLRDYLKKYEMIKFWQLGDEADQAFYDDTPENFAILFRIAYKTLKEVNPKAELVLSKQAWWIWSFLWDKPSLEDLQKLGPAHTSIPEEERSFALRIFKELKLLEEIEKNPQKDNKYKNNPEISNEEYNLIFRVDDFDSYIDGVILPFWHPSISMSEEWRQKVINNLKSYGLENKILQWSIDTLGYYKGIAGGGPSAESLILLPEEVNERTGAMALIKGVSIQGTSLSKEIAYIRLFVNGFEKVGYSGYLVNSDGSKRLEWFSHKLMAEKLKGFASAEKLAEGQYKFNFKDKNPVWVLWGSPQGRGVAVDVGNIKQVKITKAIPKYNTGKEVTDYNTAFETEIKSAADGKITLTLTETPVYIEKK